jgi:hypothetical protein
MKASTKRESFYYMVDFTQNMFSLDVNDLDEIFKDDLPYNENDVYVSRVNYGRRGIIIVKSKLDFKSFGLDVAASMKSLLGGNASVKAGVKTLNRNESFDIKALFYGGTSGSAVRSFNTMMKTKNVDILEWLEDKSDDIGYALPISYQLKNLKNESVGLKSVFNQPIRTCVPIPQENVRLKVTLTKIGCEQGRDNKGLFADGDNPDDYGIQQWMNYKVNGKFKKSTKGERIIRVNKSLLKAKENISPWKNRNIIILGNIKNQIHIREGEKKRINNSIVFNIKSKELADNRATFRIHTWLKEYTGSEDKIIANDKFIDVKINEVVAYLLDPNSFGNDYFNEEVRSGNGYISFHNYGAKDAVMWMRDGGNGSLLGEVAYSFRNSDMHMRTRFFLRFEIIK